MSIAHNHPSFPTDLQVSADSPQFFEFVVASKVPGVYIIKPDQMNERLAQQQGLFLALGATGLTFEQNLLSFGDDLKEHLVRVEIPSSVRGEALTDLRRMNITRATLFPGIDGFAQSIRQELSLDGDPRLIRTQLDQSMNFGSQFSEAMEQIVEATMLRNNRQLQTPPDRCKSTVNGEPDRLDKQV